MKIQYLSDLHMEFAENSRYLKNVEFPVTGDILVLAKLNFIDKRRLRALA